MGAGKSTVGRLVAGRAGVPFVDLDAEVERRAGRSTSAIFASEGEPGFRRREAEALAELLDQGTVRVVALGGGALLDRTRRRDALTRACIVVLDARPETFVARTAGPGRPLLEGAPDRLQRVRELLEARAEAYAEAHAVIASDELAPELVAERVLEAWAQPSVAVPLGRRSYAVRLCRDAPALAARAVRELRPSQVFVLTDETVQQLWGAGLREALAAQGVAPAATVVIPPGEEHKRLSTVERALGDMVSAGADRDALVVGHGGGVVTDMAGLAAALLLRGVRWVALPTTLLSMVDASVGGKTAVDLGLAKNAVGAFHQPSAVVIDTAHVRTEGERAWASGLAEVVKSACLGDVRLFVKLEAHAAAVRAREAALVDELVVRSVAVKAAIVSRDERESGERAHLNFGHTIGHALEAEGGFLRLTHGEAVALGMVAALRVGVALGVTPTGLAKRVLALLNQLGLPTDLDAEPLARALPLVTLDKKRRAGAVRFVLLQELGEPLTQMIPPSDLPGLLGRDA
jgi:shikimate kinase/3-dehydroquinate synthase